MEHDVNNSQLQLPTRALARQMCTTVNMNTHCHAHCEGVGVGDAKSRKTRIRRFLLKLWLK